MNKGQQERTKSSIQFGSNWHREAMVQWHSFENNIKRLVYIQENITKLYILGLQWPNPLVDLVLMYLQILISDIKSMCSSQ